MKTLFKFQHFYHIIPLILGGTKMYGDIDTIYTLSKSIMNMGKAIWQVFYTCSHRKITFRWVLFSYPGKLVFRDAELLIKCHENFLTQIF